MLIISIINAIVNILFEWVFVEYAKEYWWEKKSKKTKEKIRNEKNREMIRPYQIETEVPIRKYINLYYHERRNKIKNNKGDEDDDMYFADCDEDDAIELEDMTQNGNVIQNQ